MKKKLRPISRLKQKRRQGFRQRMARRGGRAVLRRRRQKGRKTLTP